MLLGNPKTPPGIGEIDLIDDRSGQSQPFDVRLDGVDMLAARRRQINPDGSPERISLLGKSLRIHRLVLRTFARAGRILGEISAVEKAVLVLEKEAPHLRIVATWL